MLAENAQIGGANNKYRYSGKELQEDAIQNGELDWYDYGARFYDAALGRWHLPDPVAEKSYSKTPFHYCSNNPISRFDPDGRDDYYYNKGNWQIKRNDNKYHTLTINGGLQWRSDKLYVGALDRIHLENTVTFMMAPQNKGIYNDMLSRAKTNGFEADVQLLYLEDLIMGRATGSDDRLQQAFKLFQTLKKMSQNELENDKTTEWDIFVEGVTSKEGWAELWKEFLLWYYANDPEKKNEILNSNNNNTGNNKNDDSGNDNSSSNDDSFSSSNSSSNNRCNMGTKGTYEEMWNYVKQRWK